MLIVVEDYALEDSGVLSISSEVSTMPGSNLKVLQLSKRARTTTISDTPYFAADLAGSPIGSIGLAYNFVGVLGYDGAPSRNWHTNANLLNHADWTRTNLLIGNSSEPPPADFAFRVWTSTVTGAGIATLTQVFDKPGKGSVVIGSASLALSSAFLVKQDDDADLRIRAFSGLGGTHFAYVDFDLSAGTAGTPVTGGSFSGASASHPTDLGDGWYLCRFSYTTDSADDLSVTYQYLTAAGSTTMAGGENLFLGAPVTMLQSADTASAEYPITVHDGGGPMFQVRLAYGTLSGGEITAARSGWKHCATRNFMRGTGGRFHFYHYYGSTHYSTDTVRVELWDPSNENAYIEGGRLVVAQVKDLGSRHAPAFSIGIEETGGQSEQDGGQIYRPQRKVRKRHAIRLHYATRAEAMDDLLFLMRAQGRSRQVTLIADENDTYYGQEFMMYGFIDALSRIVHEAPDFWHIDLELVETP